MRLNHQPTDVKPWAVFEEIAGKKFYDFSEVRRNIEILTDKVAGNTKNIVDKPIVLNIFSHTCPDLTLIDLPGITRNPLPGQAQDIHAQILTLIDKYIEPLTAVSSFSIIYLLIELFLLYIKRLFYM